VTGAYAGLSGPVEEVSDRDRPERSKGGRSSGTAVGVKPWIRWSAVAGAWVRWRRIRPVPGRAAHRRDCPGHRRRRGRNLLVTRGDVCDAAVLGGSDADFGQRLRAVRGAGAGHRPGCGYAPASGTTWRGTGRPRRSSSSIGWTGSPKLPNATNMRTTVPNVEENASPGVRRRWRIQRLPAARVEDRARCPGHRNRPDHHGVPPTAWHQQVEQIKHRLFSHISMNWRGRPLTSHEVILDLIGATITRPSLTVYAELDNDIYPPASRSATTQ